MEKDIEKKEWKAFRCFMRYEIRTEENGKQNIAEVYGDMEGGIDGECGKRALLICKAVNEREESLKLINQLKRQIIHARKELKKPPTAHHNDFVDAAILGDAENSINDFLLKAEK